MATTKTTKAKVKKKAVTHVKAKIERKAFDHYGKKHSSELTQYFNPEEWRQFQQEGPRQGWFVNEIIESPSGINLDYINPGE